MTFRAGSVTRAAVIRIHPGSDLIEGIEKACLGLNVRCASITSSIGSLRRSSFLIAVPLKNKVGAGYSAPKRMEGPLELLSAQGSIGLEEDGRLFVHLHGVLSDKEGNVHGGHFLKGENPVLITCEISLLPIEGVELRRSLDPEVEMEVLSPR
jgi:predicted DNA-binding protein with PD1-like motif